MKENVPSSPSPPSMQICRCLLFQLDLSLQSIYEFLFQFSRRKKLATFRLYVHPGLVHCELGKSENGEQETDSRKEITKLATAASLSQLVPFSAHLNAFIFHLVFRMLSRFSMIIFLKPVTICILLKSIWFPLKNNF